MNLQIEIERIDGFRDDQQAKIRSACALIGQAVNTPEFIDRMMAMTYEKVTTTGRWWWKTYTTETVPGFYFAPGETVYDNATVMKMINDAIEMHHDPVSGKIVLDLDCVFGHTSATAYGLPSDNNIEIYSWWIDAAGLTDLMNTIFHEWLHKLGFEHDFQPTANRDDSVPYKGGDTLQDVADEKIASGEFKI